ncbi:uncharacterized protein LOC100511352 isoform X3 [Sus scrofa]|uniref:uncharacterized protein LOC100511352 isoform X3 n=1 Tax=Sus scrofa TaxID=9823 RepID=UPI000A2B8CC9|nr:uncharacterized protein LOC100511352 isoform X3 [Sus scrofa]
MRGRAGSGLGPHGHRGAERVATAETRGAAGSGGRALRKSRLHVLAPAGCHENRYACPLLQESRKRACRRLEVAQDGGCPQVKARPPESWGSREPESPDRGRLPAPRPDGGQGRPGVESLRIGGRSPAQPCPRCLAGESVGGSVPTQPPTDLPPAAGPCPRASDLTSASHGGHFNHTENR